MSRAPARHRPGLARADRRELELIRDWVTRLDEAPLRAALAALLEVDGTTGPRERLEAIVGKLGLAPRVLDGESERVESYPSTDGWTARRCADGFLLRFVNETDAFELAVLGDTVRFLVLAPNEVTRGDADDASGGLLEEALDASAGPVLRWLRSSGKRPAQASRLAALYAPRLRGSSWPSSHR